MLPSSGLCGMDAGARVFDMDPLDGSNRVLKRGQTRVSAKISQSLLCTGPSFWPLPSPLLLRWGLKWPLFFTCIHRNTYEYIFVYIHVCM